VLLASQGYSLSGRTSRWEKTDDPRFITALVLAVLRNIQIEASVTHKAETGGL
jgi:hypothetical protein